MSLSNDCLSRILAFAGEPSSAVVCKAWGRAQAIACREILAVYLQDQSISIYIPRNDTPPVALKLAYFRISRCATTCFFGERPVSPLDLKSILKLVEDVNRSHALIKFFSGASIVLPVIEKSILKTADSMRQWLEHNPEKATEMLAHAAVLKPEVFNARPQEIRDFQAKLVLQRQ